MASTQPIPVVMATSSQQGRIARTQATTRQINEQIEQAHPAVDGYIQILCECGQLECDRLIAITVAEYEALRADATRFAVVRAHVIPEVERVVEETDRYTVVAKREGRVAHNERTARSLNESIEQAPTDTGASTDEGVHFRIPCECGRTQCDRVLAITIAEYEALRAHPRRFAVARGHVTARIEQVVTRTNRYVVVERREGDI